MGVGRRLFARVNRWAMVGKGKGIVGISSETQRVGSRYTCDRCGDSGVVRDDVNAAAPYTSDILAGWHEVVLAPLQEGSTIVAAGLKYDATGNPWSVGLLCRPCSLIVHGWTNKARAL